MIHRHLEVPADTPIEELPLAAIHDLLDRGDLDDWRPLLGQIERDPDGGLASAVGRLVDVYPMYGTSPLLRAWIERCRNRRAGPVTEEEEAAAGVTLAELRRAQGRTQAEVARAMGISQSDYSKLERRRDVRVSTLRSVAGALGGSLHLVIRLPGRRYEVTLPARSRR